jgi:hypothetical protein
VAALLVLPSAYPAMLSWMLGVESKGLITPPDGDDDIPGVEPAPDRRTELTFRVSKLSVTLPIPIPTGTSSVL